MDNKHCFYKVCGIGCMLIWDYVFTDKTRAIHYATRIAWEGVNLPGIRLWKEIKIWEVLEGENKSKQNKLIWAWDDSQPIPYHKPV